MSSLALAPLLSSSGADEHAVMTALLESLGQMVSRDHRPSSCLLVRLTDGRVKIVASPEGSRQAHEEALRIRNEYGPFSLAFSIEVDDGPRGIRFVIENLGRRGPARMEHQCGSAGEIRDRSLRKNGDCPKRRAKTIQNEDILRSAAGCPLIFSQPPASRADDADVIPRPLLQRS